MRVLVIDEWLPWPLESGKKIRTYNLLAGLAKEFDVTLLAYASLPAESEKVEALAGGGIRVVTVEDDRVPKWGLRFYAHVLMNCFSGKPFSTGYHVRPAFTRRLEEIVRTEKPDLVHCEWTNLAPALERVGNVPRVISAHNIESQIWKRFASNSRNPAVKFVAFQQAKKIERLERRWYPSVDCCTAVSEDDARVMRSYGASVVVVENGVDLDYYDVKTPGENGRKDLVFTASFDVFTNRDAVHFFIRDVLPIIRQDEPGAHFWIVGKAPPESIRRYAESDSNVHVTGSVPDVRKYIGEAAVSVVPLRIGGGSRLKILEAMAMKKPVVSTSIGAEGIEATNGLNILIGDTPDELAASVLLLLGDAKLRASLGEAAFELARSRYDWKALVRKQGEVWKGLLRG